MHEPSRYPPRFPPPFADAWGDDPFGLWADFILPGGETAESVTQRLRWIEPGSFLMGSPEDEPGRDSDEGPRHAVTLTQGYWLADTPCTQALWQAVMGDNPSRIKSPDRPVEQMSWDAVQDFLRKLEALLPNIGADLPTEAEWEYACRAGTATALYTGPIEILGANHATALDAIAWYGGNSGVGFELDNGYDSSGWPDKQYPHTRAGTHPVGQKQPNAWGLYDTLGNVWEWCADPLRTYGAEPVVDPLGPAGDGRSPRAVRGGSWNGYARGVRSAYRGRIVPGLAYVNLGFRLCLRSIETGQVRRDAGQGGP